MFYFFNSEEEPRILDHQIKDHQNEFMKLTSDFGFCNKGLAPYSIRFSAASYLQFQ